MNFKKNKVIYRHPSVGLNPHWNSSRQPKSKRFIVLISALFFIILSGFFYVLLFSPVFIIRDVKYEGDLNLDSFDRINKIIQDAFLSKKLFVFNEKNLFMFPVKKTEQKIKEDSQIADVAITKEWPNILIVKIKSSEKHLIAVNKLPEIDKPIYFYINERGEVIGEVESVKIRETSENGKKLQKNVLDLNLPKVLIISEIPLEEKKHILSQEMVIKIEQLFSLIKKDDLFAIEYFLVPIGATREIRVKAQNQGWIYFNSEREFDGQINKLKILIKEELDSLAGLEYIDLRIEDKIFYR